MSRIMENFFHFTYDDLPCKIRKHYLEMPMTHDSLGNSLGSMEYYCGYVGVKRGHSLYEVSYDDIHELYVFGGVTYTGMEEDDLWWIGFDTYHPRHGKDGKIESWTKEEAISETEYLADQIKQWNLKQLLL